MLPAANPVLTPETLADLRDTIRAGGGQPTLHEMARQLDTSPGALALHIRRIRAAAAVQEPDPATIAAPEAATMAAPEPATQVEAPQADPEPLPTPAAAPPRPKSNLSLSDASDRLDLRKLDRSFLLDPEGTLAEVERFRFLTSRDAEAVIWAVINAFEKRPEATLEERERWIRRATEILTRRGFFVPVFLMRQQASPEVGRVAVEVTQEVLDDCAPALAAGLKMAEMHTRRLARPRHARRPQMSQEAMYERALNQSRLPGF
jgi:hypothetical protein